MTRSGRAWRTRMVNEQAQQACPSFFNYRKRYSAEYYSIMGAFSIWHLLVILAIVILLFGTKRLRNIGSDMGNAIKSFRTAVKDEDSKGEESQPDQAKREGGNLPPKDEPAAGETGRVIDGESSRENTKP